MRHILVLFVVFINTACPGPSDMGHKEPETSGTPTTNFLSSDQEILKN